LTKKVAVDRTGLQSKISKTHWFEFKFYISRLVHGFLEGDMDRRLQFCEPFLNEC
jgi:hypothetical protein